MSGEVRRQLPVLGAFAVLTGLALQPLWEAGRIFGFRDLLVYFLPMRVFAHHAWTEGFFPFRNPYLACGNPFFANPETQLLYPPAWGYLILGLRAGTVLYYGAHLLAGAFGANLLARRLGAGRAGAAAAGVVFGFSGFAFSTFELQNVMCDRWIPWILWAALGVRERGSTRRVIGLGVLVALMSFGGEPALWGVTVLLAGLVVVWPPVTWGRVKSAGLTLGLAGLLGIGQLAPTAFYILDTQRWEGFVAGDVAQWSLGGWELFEMVSPEVLAGDGFSKRLGGQTYVRSVYMGVLAAALLVLRAFCGRITRTEWVLVGLGTLFLLFALGEATPVFGLYRLLTLGVVRYPARFVSLVSLAAALLVSFALSRVFVDGSRVAPLMFAVALLYVGGHLLSGWTVPEAFDRVLSNGLRGGGVLLGAALVAAIQRPRMRRGLILVLLAADLLYLPRRPELYTVDASSVERPACEAEWTPLLEGGRYRVMSLVSGSAAFAHTHAVPVELRPADAMQLAFGLAGMPCGVRSARTEPVLPLAEYERWLKPIPRILGRASVRVLLMSTGPAPGEIRVGTVDARPRFSLARLAHLDPGGEEGSALLARLALDEVLLNEEPRHRSFGTGTISVRQDQPQRIALDVNLADEGLVVLTERWEPNWQASIDGVEVRALRADRMFLGVPVPAGTHQLVLEYRAVRTMWALGLSAIVWLLAGVVWLAAGRRRVTRQDGSNT